MIWEQIEKIESFQVFRIEIVFNNNIMDVAAFSGDNFDPKVWINKALKSGDEGQSKEEAAASLVIIIIVICVTITKIF